ncbi:hypothetical protein SLA2020_123450 [Shorea laevis]
MVISVNKTTDKHGGYKLEIPHVDGVDCVEVWLLSQFAMQFNKKFIFTPQCSSFKGLNKSDVNEGQTRKSLHLQLECTELQAIQTGCYLVRESQGEVAKLFGNFKMFSAFLPSTWFPLAFPLISLPFFTSPPTFAILAFFLPI